MLLKDLFQDLALGELQGSPVVETGGFTVADMQVPKVIQAINQALEHFYSIYPLKEAQVIIEMIPEMYHYYVSSEFAMSNDSAKYKYVMDSKENPYEDDLLKVLEVRTLTGEPVSIDDTYARLGVKLPEFNCLVPTEELRKYEKVVVRYKAKHKRIPYDEPIDSRWIVNIPASYSGALQAYIASNIYNALGGGEYAQLGQFYFGKYKSLMEELMAVGFGSNQTLGINTGLYRGGWR